MALEVGGAFWMSFLVGVTVAMLTGFAYAELITKYPQAARGRAVRAQGLRETDPDVRRDVLHAGIAAAGTLALVFGGPYFQDTLVDLPTKLVAVLFVVLLALLNFRGISESVKANLVMTLVEFTGLLLILVIGAVVLGSGDADSANPSSSTRAMRPGSSSAGPPSPSSR